MCFSVSDLAVSVYDPVDNLKFYGSPVERDDLSDSEVEESACTAQATKVVIEPSSGNKITHCPREQFLKSRVVHVITQVGDLCTLRYGMHCPREHFLKACVVHVITA